MEHLNITNNCFSCSIKAGIVSAGNFKSYYLMLRLVELYGRTRLLLDVLRFFTTNGFNWSNDNTLKMYSDMSEHDRKVCTYQFDNSSALVICPICTVKRPV